jgi:hypothetical protein
VWLLRELIRLLIRIAVAASISFVIAAVLALVTGGSFTKDARIFTIVIGCMLLAMAGVGRGSNVERFMDQNVSFVFWGTIPGFNAMRPRGEDPTLAPGAAFFCSGLVLLALGIFVF